MGKVFFDLETKRTFQEVGGRENLSRLGVSCAVIFREEDGRYISFTEEQIGALVDELISASLIIGFNLIRFDYPVLSAYTEKELFSLPTLDILKEVERGLGFRLSLSHLSSATLGKKKKGDGLDAIRWYKEGKMDKLIEYCRYDVQITKEIYEFGKKNGFLYWYGKYREKQKVRVRW
jgi:DEAD/DEAH box helicase domain-containing protein